MRIKIKRNTKVFWYHYNKPASKKVGKPQITVHYDGKCHLVDNIAVSKETYGHIRKTQPFFVIKGKCDKLEIKDGICYVS